MNGNQVNGNNGVNQNQGGVSPSTTSTSSVNKANKVLMPALAKPTPPTPTLFQEGMQRVDKPAK